MLQIWHYGRVHKPFMDGRMKFILAGFGLLSACETINKVDEDTADTGDNTVVDTNDYEPGCFVVDGGDGYALLNDAISVASDGSEITMDSCGALHEEMVEVNKSVSIIGPGSGSFTLTPPTNENAFNISAPNVSISGVSINSTRSGIVATGSSDMTIDDVVVRASGNWGVKAIDSSLTITNSEFSQNGFGGINGDSSQITISDSILTENVSYGIYGLNESNIDVTDTSITLTLSSGSEDTTDGIGVYVEGSSLAMISDTDISTNATFSAYGISSSLYLTRVAAGGTQFGGIWIEGIGDLSLIEVDIIEAPVYGVIAQNVGALTIESTSISTDSTLSPSTDAEVWRDEGFASMGLFTTASSVSITGLEITGYNNCGAYFSTSIEDATIEVDGLNIHDIGRLGTYIIGYEGTINDLSIDSIFELDGTSDESINSVCSFVDRYVGAVIVDNVDLSNVSFTNIEGYGLSAIQGSLGIDTITANNNTCASVISFESAMFLSNGDFSGPNAKQFNLGASVVAYNSSVLSVESSYFEGLPLTETVYDYQIYSVGTPDLQVSSSTFTDGYYGVFADSSKVEATGNTFSGGYGGSLVLQFGSEYSHTLTDNTFVGSELNTNSQLNCYSSGQIELNGGSFTDNPYSAIYMYGCGSEIDTLTVQDIGGAGISAYDGDHEWDKLTFQNVGVDNFASGAIEFRATSAPSLLSLSSSSFNTVGSDALYIYSYGTSSPITMYATDIELSDVTDDGLYTYGTTGTISGLSISNTGGDALSNISSDLTLSDVTLSQIGSYGVYGSSSFFDITSLVAQNTAMESIYISNSDLSATDVTITNSGTSAVFSNNSTVSLNTLSIDQTGGYGVNIVGDSSNPSSTLLNGLNIDNATLSGLRLQYTNGDLINSIISNNLEYGIECTDAIMASCGGNILNNNLLGEQTGCDSACGEEANPVIDPPIDDTGITDTGSDTASQDTGNGDTATR